MVLKKTFYILCFWLISSCSNNKVSSELSGKELFNNSCAACHGTDGKLELSGATDLTKSRLKKDSVKSIIINGRKGMPSQTYAYTDTVELGKIVDFVINLR
jgi:mono/diheme cytochrome c family protein